MLSSTGSRTTTNRALLFSGGLDSFILWHLLDYPTPVYVTLGHKYERRELATIERLGMDVESGDRAGVTVVLVEGGSAAAADLRATGRTVLPGVAALPDLLGLDPVHRAAP